MHDRTLPFCIPGAWLVILLSSACGNPAPDLDSHASADESAAVDTNEASVRRTAMAIDADDVCPSELEPELEPEPEPEPADPGADSPRETKVLFTFGRPINPELAEEARRKLLHHMSQ